MIENSIHRNLFTPLYLTFSRNQTSNFFKKTTRFAKMTITLDIEELEGKKQTFLKTQFKHCSALQKEVTSGKRKQYTRTNNVRLSGHMQDVQCTSSG